MTPYAEALDELLAMRRFTGSPAGREWIHHVTGRVDAVLEQQLQAMTLGLLRQAEAYYWSADMSELVATAARGIPRWTLLPESAPTRGGWFHFTRPLPVPPVPATHGISEPINEDIGALLWGAVPELEGLALVTYTRPAGALRQSDFFVWRWGDDQVQALEQFARGIVDPARTRFGQPEVQRYLTDERVIGARRRRLDYLATAFELLHQQILVPPRREIDRASRRRLEHAGETVEPSVRVVELRSRRPIGAADHDNGEGRTYSAHWVVRGHWRRQACGPGRRDRRPTWIVPYQKGDPALPLQVKPTVFAVVR